MVQQIRDDNATLLFKVNTISDEVKVLKELLISSYVPADVNVSTGLEDLVVVKVVADTEQLASSYCC